MIKTIALASAAILALATSPASAATTLTLTPVFGVPTATFGNLNPLTTSGSHTDVFNFTVPTNGSVFSEVGSVGVRFFRTDLDFTKNGITLNGNPFTVLSSGIVENQAIFLPVSAGLQTLSITYKNAQRFASYGGVVSFFAAPTPPAVPEPATWGMMILGFGMVGAGMRYRRRETAVRFA